MHPKKHSDHQDHWLNSRLTHAQQNTEHGRELSRFIASGRLSAKIDKVGGVVETSRPDTKNAQYQVRSASYHLGSMAKVSLCLCLCV